jgi:predicted transcriptional regulator
LTTPEHQRPAKKILYSRSFKQEESELLRMDQYELVRTSHRVYGKNISEIARLTGHSRNTIKKAIRGELWGYRERQHQPFPALEPFLKVIETWLKEDKDQPKKQRHTARRIYHRLVAEHALLISCTLLVSSKEQNRLVPVRTDLDRCTNRKKRLREATRKATDVPAERVDEGHSSGRHHQRELCWMTQRIGNSG